LTNPWMYGFYPEAVCGIAEDFFRAEERGHAKLLPLAWRHLRRRGLLGIARDAWQAARAFLA